MREHKDSSRSWSLVVRSGEEEEEEEVGGQGKGLEPGREAEEEQRKEKQQCSEQQAMGGTSGDGSACDPHSYIPQCSPSSPPHAWLPPRGSPHSISQEPRILLGSGVSSLLGFLQRIGLVAS